MTSKALVVDNLWGLTLILNLIDTINKFFNVTFDLSSGAAICTFLNQRESTTKTCTLVYNQSESCQLDTPDMSQTAQSASNVVRVSFPLISESTEQHCFVVSASNGTYRAIIKGTLNTGTIIMIFHKLCCKDTGISCCIGCDPSHLYNGLTVSSPTDIASCDPPLSYIGTSDGYACYSGTLVGTYAVHRCLNCDYRSVRVCTADGNWNGTTPQCKCIIQCRAAYY